MCPSHRDAGHENGTAARSQRDREPDQIRVSSCQLKIDTKIIYDHDDTVIQVATQLNDVECGHKGTGGQGGASTCPAYSPTSSGVQQCISLEPVSDPPEAKF